MLVHSDTVRLARISITLTALGLSAIAAAQVADPRFAAQLEKIETRVAQRQKELGVPGVALVVVKDDKVVFMKGFGYRDLDKKLPVTPSTLFGIGSLTKSFTAMLAMMSVEEGKLAMSDHPRKHLPYFRLRDNEANRKATFSNLLSHTTGYAKTDLAWVTGKLNREELIRTVLSAKPTVPFGSFGYSNVMYTAAGEALAKINRMPYEDLVRTRILQPLGMNATNLSVSQMQASADYSKGYTLGATNSEVPVRDDPLLGPAGSINSNLQDMSRYLRLMLGKGTLDGKRLISEKSYQELITKRVDRRPGVGYAYGWNVADWNGHKLIRHGGNIPGYNSDMGMLPDQKLGYVMLTNVADSLLGDEIDRIVWEAFLGAPPSAVAPSPIAVKPLPAGAKDEVGLYRAADSPNEFKVYMEGGKMYLAGTGQPTVELLHDAGRRYRMGPPAPSDFAATFRPWEKDPSITELYLEEGGMKYLVRKVPPFAPPISVDTLMVNVLRASGVEKLREHKSLQIKSKIDFENEGLTGTSVMVMLAPNARASVMELFAIGKHVATIRDYFDGKAGGDYYSWASTRTKAGRALANAALAATFTGDLEWKTLYKSVEIIRLDNVNGEEAYVVAKTPFEGSPITQFYSTKTFLLLRTGDNPQGYSTYGDYRSVKGVMVPFLEINQSASVGRLVRKVTEVKFDLPLSDSLFRPE
jgi:CubicO group peptidase (beta-lactamase class C family)